MKPHCFVSWTNLFAAVGIVLPIICLIFDFHPGGLRRICELCWPTGFLLLAADGHFNLALASISVGLNGVIWGGLGWLIDYGTSR